MAVRWWTSEGLQIPASVSSEHGPTKRVRRATATPLMPPVVQWILCSSSPLEGSALRIWWASAYSAPLPETTQQGPLISPTPPSVGSANCAMPSIDRTPESPLDAQVWVSSATDLNCTGEAIPELSM
jgi:hypothetical protein